MPLTSSEYTLTDSFVGKQFLDSFNWFNAPDPTHGRVKYVDKDTALKTNLSWGEFANPFSPAAISVHLEGYGSLMFFHTSMRPAGDTQFVMRADDWSKTGDEGRPSVRIQSQKTFGDVRSIFPSPHRALYCL